MILVLVTILIGAFVRGHGLSRQLPVSDEWHALHAAATCDASTLFTLMTPGATSIPMNLYDRALLHTVGWSEWSLRLPAFLSGLLLVALAPWLLAGLLTPRARVLTCALLAIAPFLVFFSRYARPYAPVALLTFLTVVEGWRFARTGRTRSLIVCVASGVLAAWLHVIEARVVLFVLLVLLLLPRLMPQQVKPRRRMVVTALVIALGDMAVLLLPAYWNTGERLFGGLQQADSALTGLLGSLHFFAGTQSPVWIALFVALVALGAWTLWRADRLFAVLCGTVVVGCAAVVLVSRPVLSHVPIVAARYVLPALPLLLVACAAGADALLRALEDRRLLGNASRVGANALAFALPVSLFLTGPLPRQLTTVNDFTNHKAFQVAYDEPPEGTTWTQRFRSAWTGEAATTEAPPDSFYARLASLPGNAPIIETPLYIGDVANDLADHQWVHGRRVLGGFVPDVTFEGEAVPGIVDATWPVDAVLSLVQDPTRLKFDSLVDLSDLAAVRASGAEFVIARPGAPIDRLRDAFGEPVESTEFTAVFQITRVTRVPRDEG